MKKLNLFELFCGVGGLSHGFEQTGRFEVVAGLEWDPTIAESYSKNNPDAQVFVGDICLFDVEEVAKKIGKPIDIIVGGPPCQGFSVFGNRIAYSILSTLIHFNVNAPPPTQYGSISFGSKGILFCLYASNKIFFAVSKSGRWTGIVGLLFALIITHI